MPLSVALRNTIVTTVALSCGCVNLLDLPDAPVVVPDDPWTCKASSLMAEPQAKAEWLVGRLASDEIEQILWLSGNGETLGLTKQAFVAQLDEALDEVWAAIDCPDPPCPSPFSTASM